MTNAFLARSIREAIACHLRVALSQILWGVLAITLATIGCSKDSNVETPLAYEGQTAAQWIRQLKSSSDADTRATAAEALGYMARESKLTLGGFSDVPYESTEPPTLEKKALQSIVAALVSGLKDSDERVRASSAIAVSWIGSRAKPAVPMLIRVLEDAHAGARKNALSAIGSIGPDANAAIPVLETMVKFGDANSRVDFAGALHKVGAAPGSYIPILIDALGTDAAHYAAMELADVGDSAVVALKQALSDENPQKRQSAAYAIGNMAGLGKLTKDRESVADLLIELTRDDKPDVIWYSVQAIALLHTSAERSVPALIGLLTHPDKKVANMATESLGIFGAEAKPALTALIGLLREGIDEDHSATGRAIRQIGLDLESADAIHTLKVNEHRSSWLFMPMCEYPDLAVEFLKMNPQAVHVPARDIDTLIHHMKDPDPGFRRLQEALYKSEHLPLEVIAQLGERRFLELIVRKRTTANAYEKTRLNACARACGELTDRIVLISESKPGDFKPSSAWPNTDPARIATGQAGHGDGGTTVIVTGQILRESGGPAIHPKFYRINDSMLLGEKVHQEVPITFDARSGRFVFITNVFAAYSMGDGQREVGPYQTGSSTVLIESDGCKPLQVHFFDEMPEVRITMSTGEK